MSSKLWYCGGCYHTVEDNPEIIGDTKDPTCSVCGTHMELNEVIPVEMGILLSDHTWYSKIYPIPTDEDPVSHIIDFLEMTQPDLEISHVFVYNDDVSEPPEVDDRAPCKVCGSPMDDADYDDNHGVCNSCCETHERE